MAKTGRPTLHLRLDADSGPQGEIRLAELAKVADQTQRIITHIAQRLVGDTITDRATTNIASATTLSLVGWAHIAPRVARQALRRAEGAPDVPYVSAHHQALTGKLYALNLRTGTFKIEDGLGHSIPLVVPEHVRGDASQFIGRPVRVIGSATLDERHRLQSFVVSSLEETPEHLFRQSEFFDRHELIIPPRSVANSELDSGVIPDLSDDEIAQFMLAFDEAD